MWVGRWAHQCSASSSERSAVVLRLFNCQETERDDSQVMGISVLSHRTDNRFGRWFRLNDWISLPSYAQGSMVSTLDSDHATTALFSGPRS